MSEEKNLKKARFEKNYFKSQISLLDDFNNESEINKSYFHGFKNMGKVIGLFFIITTPLVNYTQTSQIIVFFLKKKDSIH